MKKLLLVLGMITCMFGMTACGSTEEVVDNYGVTEEQAIEYANNLIDTMNQVVLAEQEALYEDDAVISAGLASFSSALSEMGDYQSVTDHEVIYDDGIVINVGISGTLKEATVEIIMDEDLNLTGISTNVVYTFGEMMAKAGLNTLMGMGTVFAVLILISLLISCFSFIPKIQEKFTKKPEVKAEPAAKVAEQIIENEELSDDLELVAVISAAIAAYEGSASANGYVVRSIKRRNR